MIRMILMILMELLGFNSNSNQPVNSLHRQPQPQNIVLTPGVIMIVGGLLMIIFVVVCLLFVPGTESGVWYNQPHI